MRQTIRKFKFDGHRQLAGPLSQLLCDVFQTCDIDETFDWIVPVPSHPRRRRQRGFDHAETLASRLSSRLGIPCFKGLQRKRDTKPQFGLSRNERRRNLQGAFALRQRTGLQGSGVILVDDILTTGATINEAARVLRREGGADRILVLVIARRLRAAEN